jgi:hypothetical protein
LWLFTPLVSFWFLRKQKYVGKPNQKGLRPVASSCYYCNALRSQRDCR